MLAVSFHVLQDLTSLLFVFLSFPFGMSVLSLSIFSTL